MIFNITSSAGVPKMVKTVFSDICYCQSVQALDTILPTIRKKISASTASTIIFVIAVFGTTFCTPFSDVIFNPAPMAKNIHSSFLFFLCQRNAYVILFHVSVCFQLYLAIRKNYLNSYHLQKLCFIRNFVSLIRTNCCLVQPDMYPL